MAAMNINEINCLMGLSASSMIWLRRACSGDFLGLIWVIETQKRDGRKKIESAHFYLYSWFYFFFVIFCFQLTFLSIDLNINLCWVNKNIKLYMQIQSLLTIGHCYNFAFFLSFFLRIPKNIPLAVTEYRCPIGGFPLTFSSEDGIHFLISHHLLMTMVTSRQ